MSAIQTEAWGQRNETATFRQFQSTQYNKETIPLTRSSNQSPTAQLTERPNSSSDGHRYAFFFFEFSHLLHRRKNLQDVQYPPGLGRVPIFLASSYMVE